mgnify:CR=1 FL=1
MTKDNIEKPWILFEAGALSKNVGYSNVCPILFNFESSELTGPLLSFQATRFEKSDMKKLLKTINEACGESKLGTSVLDNVFEMWWPKLEENIKSIIDGYKDTLPEFNLRHKVKAGLTGYAQIYGKYNKQIYTSGISALQSSAPSIRNRAKSSMLFASPKFSRL